MNSDIIDKLSYETGVNYSDEQLKILNHRGGMRILALLEAVKLPR